MNKKCFFLVKSILIYAFIYSLDFFVWATLKFVPKSFAFKLAKYKIAPLPIIPQFINRYALRNRISKCLIFKQKKVFNCTSCLSLTLTGKFLCDLISIRTEIHLGMLHFLDNSKTPHAWLYDPINEIELTLRMVNNSINVIELHKF